MRVESTLHPIVCGRSRKNIKLIESNTNTAIYFPPFGQIQRYCPSTANRRNPEEIYITGENSQGIELAKRKIHDLVSRTNLFLKDAVASPAKIDTILLGRMDKVRKIMESNGTYVMFPPLASRRNMIRIQGIEGLQIERTMKEIMALVRVPSGYGGPSKTNSMVSRLASSTMRHGGFNRLAHLSCRVHRTSELCSVTFAPTRTQTFRLTR
jgi:hypothetical protein